MENLTNQSTTPGYGDFATNGPAVPLRPLLAPVAVGPPAKAAGNPHHLGRLSLLAICGALLLGRDNLQATRFHALHHRFATVRDRDLPALARLLAVGEGRDRASVVG